METFYILSTGGLIYMFLGFLVYLAVIGWSIKVHPERAFHGSTMDFLVTLSLWPGVLLGLLIAIIAYGVKHMRGP